MVASPDHLLDPRYYPEQHKEWVRPEYALRKEYEMPPLEDLRWYCECGEWIAARGLDGLWELGVGVVLIREAGKPTSLQCSCGSRGDWQEKGWGELRLRSLLNVGEEYEMPDNGVMFAGALLLACLTRWCDETRRVEFPDIGSKEEREAVLLTTLVREGWFVRRGSHNAIEGLCPDCSTQVIYDQTSWPDD